MALKETQAFNNIIVVGAKGNISLTGKYQTIKKTKLTNMLTFSLMQTGSIYTTSNRFDLPSANCSCMFMTNTPLKGFSLKRRKFASD